MILMMMPMCVYFTTSSALVALPTKMRTAPSTMYIQLILSDDRFDIDYEKRAVYTSLWTLLYCIKLEVGSVERAVYPNYRALRSKYLNLPTYPFISNAD
ncbi:hypothetical protein F5Y14DRAFT_289594 [Nemania sp. NC0429]|nr:hypothetical protein F5Y14DRAFT_289594 [Nemania sp. NC0429]